MPTLCYVKGSDVDPALYLRKLRPQLVQLYHAHVWPGASTRQRISIEKRCSSFLKAARRKYFAAFNSRKNPSPDPPCLPPILLDRGIWLTIGETPLPRSAVRLRDRSTELLGKYVAEGPRQLQTVRYRACSLCGQIHTEEIVLACKAFGWSCTRVRHYEQEARSRAWGVSARGGHTKASQAMGNRWFLRHYPFKQQFREPLGAWRTRVSQAKWEHLPARALPGGSADSYDPRPTPTQNRPIQSRNKKR